MSSSAGHFAHMVYFTLKDKSPAKVDKLVEACQKYLSNHPGTVYFSAGTLADMHREVNDRGFDVALNVVFDSQTSHDAYQAAERHLQFIEQQKSNWERVRVFDSIVA